MCGRSQLLVYLQVKHAQTLTEKILAKHSNNVRVAPGQNIWTSVDKLMTHDVCGPGTFGIFQKEFGMDAQVCAAPVCCLSAVAMVIAMRSQVLSGVVYSRSGTTTRWF